MAQNTPICTAQKAQEIPGVKYTTWNTRCILWCIPVFGVFLPLFGVFRPGIHQTPPFGVFRMVYSQSNSTYTRHFRPKMMPQCTHLIWRLLQMPQGGPTGSGCWGSSAPAALAAAAVPMWRGSAVATWTSAGEPIKPNQRGFGVFPMGYFSPLGRSDMRGWGWCALGYFQWGISLPCSRDNIAPTHGAFALLKPPSGLT